MKTINQIINDEEFDNLNYDKTNFLKYANHEVKTIENISIIEKDVSKRNKSVCSMKNEITNNSTNAYTSGDELSKTSTKININKIYSDNKNYLNEQMLLDWINTIDNPSCLLVSSFDELYDGKIFYEILKMILEKNGQEICDWIDFLCIEAFYAELLISVQALVEFYQSISENCNSQHPNLKSNQELVFRCNKILDEIRAKYKESIKGEVIDDEIIFSFKPQEKSEFLQICCILQSIYLLFDERTLSLLKSNIKNSNQTSEKLFKYVNYSENPNETNLQCQEIIKDQCQEPDLFYHHKEKELFKTNTNKNNELNYTQNDTIGIIQKDLCFNRIQNSYNDISYNENYATPKDVILKNLTTNVNKFNDNIYEKSIEKVNQIKANPNENKNNIQKTNLSEKLKEKVKKAKQKDSNPTLLKKPIYTQKELDSIRQSKLEAINNSKIISNFNIDLTGYCNLYDRRTLSDIEIFQGRPAKINLGSTFNFAYFNVLKYVKPTNLILDVKLNDKTNNTNSDISVISKISSSMTKKEKLEKIKFYYPKLNTNKTSLTSIKTQINKNKSSSKPKKDYDPSFSFRKFVDTESNNEQKNFELKYQSVNLVKQQEEDLNEEELRVLTSETVKTPKIETNEIFNYNNFSSKEYPKEKILNWINSLNLQDKKNITIESLPFLISKGVFLAELLNRIEGKQEVIKGIVKK